MSRLKFKQILSNLHYDEINDQLILSSSRIPTGELNWDEETQTWETALGNWDASREADFVISGSIFVTQSVYQSGSISIEGLGKLGDDGTIDLGEY